MRIILATLSCVFYLGCFPATADVPSIEKAEAIKSGDGSYTISVTVRHGDTGWEHYVNRWEVTGPDGTVLATRTLLHPHENEQPFTRSLEGVKIPNTVRKIKIRVHDSVHGYGPSQLEIDLEK